ncbi:hypothetical protein [Acidisoma sp. 7E03]
MVVVAVIKAPLWKIQQSQRLGKGDFEERKFLLSEMQKIFMAVNRKPHESPNFFATVTLAQKMGDREMFPTRQKTFF